ncbi:hypothetical protein GCM10009784_18190 [Arthrobacter parietis]|uniref:Transposase n=1 Tax=Arthrobacter parietis TaxID=271434 RepID=A0ABN3AVQ8_9MICC
MVSIVAADTDDLTARNHRRQQPDILQFVAHARRLYPSVEWVAADDGYLFFANEALNKAERWIIIEHKSGYTHEHRLVQTWSVNARNRSENIGPLNGPSVKLQR